MVIIARCGCVSVCSCAIQGVDSECLATDVTGQGSLASPYVIEVNPIIPAGAGQTRNLLKCEADGLKVTVEDVQDAVGQEIGPLLAGTCLVYDDTNNRVNVQIAPDAAAPTSGTGNGITCTGTGLQVIPSTDAGNQLVFGADGNLSVPPATPIVIVGDTDNDNCANITATEGPAGTWTLETSVLVDGVTVLCGPGGLSSPSVVNAIDNAQNIDVTGSGTDTLTFTCVPVPVVSNTPCLTIAGDTCNGLTLGLDFSEDQCNGIECRPNGLFVFSDPTQMPGGVESTAAMGPFGPFNGNTDVIIDQRCVTLTNPSPCRDLKARSLAQFGLDFLRTTGDFSVRMEASNNGPGGPFVVVGTAAIFNPSGNTHLAETVVWEGDGYTLAPGASITVCIRIRVVGGGGLVNGNVNGIFPVLALEPTGWMR